MLNCPRCGFSFPYWRSRRWVPRLDPPGMAVGRRCPRCDRETVRHHAPLWLRPLRLLLSGRCSYRTCACGWHGAAFHTLAPRRAPSE